MSGSLSALPGVRVEAVIWDFDGTLIDSFGAVVRAWNAAMEPLFGRTFERDEVTAHFGPPDEPMLHTAFPPDLSPEDRNAALERYFAEYEAAHDELRPFEGATQTLEWLHEHGVPQGLMTGKGRRATNISLRHFGWTKLLETSVTGDEVERVKPDAEGVLEIARRLEIAPRNCVYVGDSPVDIQAARSAGMIEVASGWHPYYADELQPLAPKFWPKAFAEFRTWLEQNLILER